MCPITLIFKNRPQLPYGNKDRGKFVPAEKGRRNILVPSFGVLEKEEVDYLVGVAQEQEDERINRGEMSEQKAQLEYIAGEMLKAPPKKRAETARKILKGE